MVILCCIDNNRSQSVDRSLCAVVFDAGMSAVMFGAVMSAVKKDALDVRSSVLVCVRIETFFRRDAMS